MITVKGYSTENNKFEELVDIQLAIKDLLMQFNTIKGDLDYYPNYGTTIPLKIFQVKTNFVKNEILTEIEDCIKNDPRFELLDIKTEDIQYGWIFHISLKYLKGFPYQWDLSVTSVNDKVLIQLGDEL